MNPKVKQAYTDVKVLMGYKDRTNEPPATVRQRLGRGLNSLGDGIFNYNIMAAHVRARARISVAMWTRILTYASRVREASKKPKVEYENFEEIKLAFDVSEDDLRRTAYRNRIAAFISLICFLVVGYFLPFSLLLGRPTLIVLHLTIIAYLGLNFLRGEWRYQQYRRRELITFKAYLASCLPWDIKLGRSQ